MLTHSPFLSYLTLSLLISCFFRFLSLLSFICFVIFSFIHPYYLMHVFLLFPVLVLSFSSLILFYLFLLLHVLIFSLSSLILPILSFSCAYFLSFITYFTYSFSFLCLFSLYHRYFFFSHSSFSHLTYSPLSPSLHFLFLLFPSHIINSLPFFKCLLFFPIFLPLITFPILPPISAHSSLHFPLFPSLIALPLHISSCDILNLLLPSSSSPHFSFLPTPSLYTLPHPPSFLTFPIP